MDSAPVVWFGIHSPLKTLLFSGNSSGNVSKKCKKSVKSGIKKKRNLIIVNEIP